MDRVRVAVSAMLLLGVAAGQQYDITSGPDSRLELIVDKTGLLRGKSHLFTFERFNGSILIEGANLTQSSVSLSIEAASALCRDEWLSAKDLKKVQIYATKDMLDAARRPTIRFSSTSIVQTAPERFDVRGVLTIRDVTRPVTVHVEIQPGATVFTGVATILLTDFKLKPPTALLGAIGTKDEMHFRFRIAARPRSHTD
jgi:polyisoprenoid-binding protein YceI